MSETATEQIFLKIKISCTSQIGQTTIFRLYVRLANVGCWTRQDWSDA